MADTVVVGIDGGSWNLVEPWVRQGRLPNLKRLREEAAWGDLESTVPAVTYPAWKCYSTGTHPGRLGVYWWLGVDWPGERIVAHSGDDFHGDEVWDVLGAAGHRVGVLNMPTTYPPRPVNGFMVSGPAVPAGRPYTYPRGLQRELERRYDYRVTPRHYLDREGEREQAVRDAHDLIDLRFRVAMDKLDSVDFLHLTLFYIDDLQHYLWDGPETREAWEIVDRWLGQLLEADVNLVVMSDHGFTELETNFYINRWLEDRGHLVTKGAAYEKLHRAGVNHDRLNRWGRALGLHKLVPRSVKEWLWETLPNAEGRVTETAREQKVDWRRSKAFANGEGPLYVNPRLDDPAGFRERLRDELLDDKEARRALKDVLRAEEAYPGERRGLAPDLVLVPREGVEIAGVLGADHAFDNPKQGGWVATHRPQGIVAVRPREGGAPGRRLEGARIYDVAPTILALHGVDAPPGLDGRVLTEAIGTAPKEVSP